MAKDIQFITTCDPCDYSGTHNVPAVRTHTISLDGGPEREIDVCARDELIFDYVLRVYTEHQTGREVPHKEPKKVKQEKSKAVPPPVTKELERKPSPTSEGVPDEVWCPLPHGTEQGTGKFVSYKSRGQHAHKVHDLEVWDIAWMDPYKILKSHCGAHAKCKESGLAFESEHGLATHVVKCPLPRIDTAHARDDNPDE